MLADTKEMIREKLTSGQYPETDIFVDYFQKKFKDGLLAVVFYGSCLSNRTRSETSFLDFFLIADNYDTFYKKWSHKFANSLIPPAVFYLELEDEKGRKRNCKYCVISLEDLEKHTSSRAKDFYHLGRFSKRIAVLYAKGAWVAGQIADVHLNAWQTLTPHALVATSNSFAVPDFVKSMLALSYHGEIRLEQTEEKVAALYEAEKEYYDQGLSVVLDQYMKNHRDQFKVQEETDEPGIFIQRRTTVQRAQQMRKLDKFFARSKRRAKMRWPLMMFTVDGWVDILLAKLERTYGTTLDLKPYERQFILIFGWKHYFRLRKEGKVK